MRILGERSTGLGIGATLLVVRKGIFGNLSVNRVIVR